MGDRLAKKIGFIENKGESQMPSLSYCAIENTASALEATVGRIEDGGARYLKSVNQYERAAYPRLLELCKRFVELHEEYQDVIESWSNNDPVYEDEDDDDDEYENEDWRSW
jgi:exonuclease VII small subunit